MRSRTLEFKPLLLTTTLRNPERMKKFLEVIKEFDGKILTNKIIKSIVYNLISRKLYIPTYVSKNQNFKKELKFIDKNFTFNQTMEIVKNSTQNHKETNFDKGWPSRFDTWYKIMKEFGFIFYEMGKPIELSMLGQKLIDSLEIGNEGLEEQVFLNSFSKYQRCNPFRRVKNENVPFILLLQVINKLKEIYGENSSGLSIREIPLLICWTNNDFEALTNLICEIRKKYSFTPSDEVIYDECKKILNINESSEKRFKINNILYELPDEFIRKVKLTGLISLRGFGKFLDRNSNEKEKIDYVINNYSSYVKYESEYDYYKYMSEIDTNLVNIVSLKLEKRDLETSLIKWVNYFEWTVLSKELEILSNPKSYSKHELLKFINNPVRLEFLVAVSLKKKFKDLVVIPNYKIDDEGVPICHASGGKADIECFDDKGNIIFEVTLLTGTQQNIREMPSIQRHLEESYSDNNINNFAVLICPKVHQDTMNYSKFLKYDKKLDIIPIEILTFINQLKLNYDIRKFKKLF